MKLLLIGGTGVLSSAVVDEAIKQKIDVTIVNRGLRKKTYPGKIHFIKADYHNCDLMHEKLKGLHFDAVVDFICFRKEQIAYSIDLLSPYADQYIFISSACVYNTAIPGKKNESAEKVLTDWDYSSNKWECEKFLESVGARKNIQYTIIRPCITYDDTRIPYGIMPPYGYHWTLVARLLAHKPIIRWNKGLAKWNMMRVEDFAVGLVGLIGNVEAKNEVFNICGDNVYSWNDVIDVISSYLNVTPIYFDVTSEEYKQCYPSRKGEIAGRSFDAVIDNSKIKTIVPSFKTTYSLIEGVEKTLNAYKNYNYQKGIDWEFDAACDRIVKKISKKHKIKTDGMNLKFVNYLGNATIKNRIKYFICFHEIDCIMNIFPKLKSVVRYVLKHVKR